jgi:hypothetical protein
MKTAYDSFKHSACFDCAYCKERKLSESESGMLDIRKNGVVKIWCYASNDVVAIMTAMEKEECPHFEEVENE